MSIPSLSVVTLGVDDIARSKHFYEDGFGWTPVFENGEIVFYQLNGLMLGTWLKGRLAEDLRLAAPRPSGGFSLAHNVAEEQHVDPLMERLAAAGGTIIRPSDRPDHGGRRGHVADPDGHAWEIAWNPGFAMDAAGNVTFGV